MPYLVGVSYSKKALSWKVVDITYLDSIVDIKVYIDYSKNCVMIPAYSVTRKGTWTNPLKVLKEFWKTHNNTIVNMEPVTADIPLYEDYELELEI